MSVDTGEIQNSKGYWSQTWDQLKHNKWSMASLALVFGMFFIAILAPLLANDRPLAVKADGEILFPAFRDYLPQSLDIRYSKVDWKSPQASFESIEWKIPTPAKHSPNTSDLSHRYEAPNKSHYLGTDDRGRDLLSRLVWGSRVSLSVGFIAMGIALFIGVILGALSGYYGGKTDIVIQRVMEIVICFPTFFLILTVLAFLPQSIFWIMIVIGITGWVGSARLVRGEFLKLRKQQFVEASRAIGANDTIIIFRHILPNAIAPVLVTASFGIAGAILTESALSFLGFGVPPPNASWGESISQAQNFIDAWWLTVFPGAAIFLTVTAYNQLGEGLRDATDPRLRELGGG